MIERCFTCRYLHKLKEFDEGNHDWIDKHICTVFPETENGYDAFALVIKYPIRDGCEMYYEAKEGATRMIKVGDKLELNDTEEKFALKGLAEAGIKYEVVTENGISTVTITEVNNG